jgi:hypothetical protein
MIPNSSDRKINIIAIIKQNPSTNKHNAHDPTWDNSSVLPAAVYHTGYLSGIHKAKSSTRQNTWRYHIH